MSHAPHSHTNALARRIREECRSVHYTHAPNLVDMALEAAALLEALPSGPADFDKTMQAKKSGYDEGRIMGLEEAAMLDVSPHKNRPLAGAAYGAYKEAVQDYKVAIRALKNAAPQARESLTNDQGQPVQPARASSEAGKDDGCICRGNWRAIVKETEPLIGKRYKAEWGPDGKREYVYTFFGPVHGGDDYYYGMMDEKGRVRLLSCVGAIEGFGFTALHATERGGKP